MKGISAAERRFRKLCGDAEADRVLSMDLPSLRIYLASAEERIELLEERLERLREQR